MLALTSPTSGGPTVSIVRFRNKATEFSLVFIFSIYFRIDFFYVIQTVTLNAPLNKLQIYKNAIKKCIYGVVVVNSIGALFDRIYFLDILSILK
jgi:hypothetical protein